MVFSAAEAAGLRAFGAGFALAGRSGAAGRAFAAGRSPVGAGARKNGRRSPLDLPDIDEKPEDDHPELVN